ncbi:MAG TPA: cyclic nucleotide-binding domain-containing protein [Stellaceae bacterium]|nr:cyclic nucleotide-binding domain-containing protein [Stellaceae bacterium]
MIELVSVRPGDFLFQENDEADALYVVRAGTLDVMRGSTVYDTVTPGGIVGELAIVDEGRRSASVLARTHSQLIKIDVPGFLDLVASEPEFALVVMQVMARRLRIMNYRYSDLSAAPGRTGNR